MKYTYKDYLNWSDEESWEIIDGTLYNISPASTRKHQKISGELFATIHSYLKHKTCEVYSAPFDVRLSINNENDEKTIVAYKLNENSKYGRPEVYSEKDKVKVGIFESLEITLSQIFVD